jgi:glycosyltransferase involved in cell wall biosynthesis
MQVNTARGWRGGERQVLWLTERLNALGVRSIVAAPPAEPLAAKLRERGLALVPFAPRGEWDLLAARRLARAASAAGAHILNAHDGHANTLAALAAGRGRRLVLTRRVHHPLRRNLVSRWKFARADAVIAISRGVAGILTDCGVRGDKIHVVHSGVPLDRARRVATPDTLVALGIPRGAALVAFVGALVGHKDPLTFVRAMAVVHRRRPDVHGLVVGDGALRGRVAEEVAALGLGEVVRLAGHRADADELLAAATVFALSSSDEGLGTVVLDAMQLGVPLVATALEPVREVVRDGLDGLLVPPREPAALGERLLELLAEDPAAAARRARLAASAEARVHDFSADRTAAETLAVYRRVLAQRAAAGAGGG